MASTKQANPLNVFMTLMTATIGDHIPFYFKSWNHGYTEENVERIILFLSKIGFTVIDVQPHYDNHIIRTCIPNFIDKPQTFSWLLSFFDKIYEQQEHFVNGNKKAPLPCFKNSSIVKFIGKKNKVFIYGTLGLFNVTIRGKNNASKMFQEARKLVNKNKYMMTLDEADHRPSEKEEARLCGDLIEEEPAQAKEPVQAEETTLPVFQEKDFPLLPKPGENYWNKKPPTPADEAVEKETPPPVDEAVEKETPPPVDEAVEKETSTPAVEEWVSKVKMLKDAGISFTVKPDGSFVF